jgi:hypothetical protein
MTPLYTVLMSLAGLALILTVCGLAVLWPSPAGATPPHPSQREK